MKKLNEVPDEELQTAYKRLLFHLENTPLGFIEWDNHLRVRSCSKRAEEIFGWSENEFKEDGKTAFSQVYDEDLPLVGKIAAELISGAVERNSIQHRNITKDGRVIWCEWFNSVLKDKGGKVIAIMSLVQDITERKAIKSKLNKINQLYAFSSQVNQNIVHLSNERELFRKSCQIAVEFGKFRMAWIGMFDKENKTISLVDQSGIPAEAIRMFDNAACQFNGPQDCVLRTGSHYICNNIRGNPVLKAWQPFAAKYSICSCMVLPIRRSGLIIGTFNLYSSTLNFSEKDEINLLVELTGDISFALDMFEKAVKQHEIEELLINNEQKFRHTLDNMLEGIQIHDFNWRYIYVNDALVKDSPYSREEMIGYTLMEKYPGIEHTDLYKKMYRCMSRRIAEHFETEFIFPNGTKAYFELSIDPIPEGISVLSVNKTEQKASKDLVINNEKRFRLLIENGTDMITLSTREGEILYGSPSIEKVFGYLPSDIIHTFSFDFIHPDDVQGFKENRVGILSTPGKSYYSQLRLRNKSGKWIWCEVTLTNMLDESGINALVSNFRDISEKRGAEKQAEFEKNNLTALINNTNDLMWSVDLDFKLITFNEPFYEIIKIVSGINLAVGDDVFSASLSNEQLTRFKIAYHRAFKGEVFTEVEYIDSPVQSWSEISYCPIRKGKEVIGTACHSRDITERKRSEESLINSESRLKEAQAIASMGSWEVDLAKNEHTWSDEMFRIFGIKKGDLKPSQEAYFSFIHPDDGYEVNKRMQDASQIFENSSFEFRFVRKDEVIRYGYSEWKFEFDKNQDPVRLFGIIQDITDRKLAEADRLKIVDSLVARNKDLEQFTYIVSHNLRAPVANILGISNLLNEVKMNSAEKNTLSRALQLSAIKLDDVVRDLNDILQIRNTSDEAKELVSFSETVNDIIISIENLIDIERIKISVNFTAVDEMFTIKSYLYSIFYNLISNSIKYRRQDILTRIKITSYLEENKLILVFSDNGMGIDLEKRGEQVFGLYKRFHSDIEGKGMGLFIVKNQVETLGGKINMKSRVNKGTDLTIEFNRQLLSDLLP